MDGHTIAIIAALIGALGAIIAAVITAIALIHSNKRNSNNPPSNTNVALPQPPAQSSLYTYKQTLWDKILTKYGDIIAYIGGLIFIAVFIFIVIASQFTSQEAWNKFFDFIYLKEIINLFK